jgi:hypothetical protein
MRGHAAGRALQGAGRGQARPGPAPHPGPPARPGAAGASAPRPGQLLTVAGSPGGTGGQLPGAMRAASSAGRGRARSRVPARPRRGHAAGASSPGPCDLGAAGACRRCARPALQGRRARPCGAGLGHAAPGRLLTSPGRRRRATSARGQLSAASSPRPGSRRARSRGRLARARGLGCVGRPADSARGQLPGHHARGALRGSGGGKNASTGLADSRGLAASTGLYAFPLDIALC